MFRVFFVCTGNRCRSPVAEAAFRRAVAGTPIAVTSAGLIEVPATPSPEATVAAARELGLDLSAHRSRGLSAVDLTTADLVVGFEFAHVSTAVVEAGAPGARAFGLVELDLLIHEIDPPPSGLDPEGRARKVVRRAHEARLAGGVPFRSVADPIGRAASEHRRTARVVAGTTDRIARALFPTMIRA
jgi:protein-tyrosine phosphatase